MATRNTIKELNKMDMFELNLEEKDALLFAANEGKITEDLVAIVGKLFSNNEHKIDQLACILSGDLRGQSLQGYMLGENTICCTVLNRYDQDTFEVDVSYSLFTDENGVEKAREKARKDLEEKQKRERERNQIRLLNQEAVEKKQLKELLEKYGSPDNNNEGF
jgi:hypothetical protein